MHRKPQEPVEESKQNNDNNSPFILTSNQSHFKCQTAWDLFNKEIHNGYITTCCKDIDQLLGEGGVQLGKITEFCGISGTGKTQIGMQCAVDVQFPDIMGGVGGQCIYIDTANGVHGARLHSIASSFVRHVHGMAAKRASTKFGQSDLLEQVKGVMENANDLLKNILIFRCFEFIDLDYVLFKLLDGIMSGKLEQYAQYDHVKLIVIDPISYLIKYPPNNTTVSEYVLKMGQLFHYLCKKYNVAIVCMNQMTTKMSMSTGLNPINDTPTDAKYVIVPGLGYVWTSIVNVRIQLMMIGDDRYAKLLKTCRSKRTNQSGRFKISGGGIRNDKTKKPAEPAAPAESE